VADYPAIVTWLSPTAGAVYTTPGTVPLAATARALTQLLTDERLRTAAVQVSREIAAMPAPTDLVARLAALV
ncbi:hypothetical protein AB0C20_35380, partial [Micromonospora sp. NPDC048843]